MGVVASLNAFKSNLSRLRRQSIGFFMSSWTTLFADTLDAALFTGFPHMFRQQRG